MNQNKQSPEESAASLPGRENNFVYYAEAVRYGIALATLREYRKRTWEEIEAQAQQHWQETYQRPWQEFSAVVKQSWAEVKTQFSEHSSKIIESDTYESAFQSHYKTHYTGTRFSYKTVAPAYHFGYDLGVDQRIRDRTWSDIEPAARRLWEKQGNVGAWEDIKDAVHYAWGNVRGEGRPGQQPATKEAKAK
jgi:hypothetical protein